MKKDHGWKRQDKLAFLMRLRSMVAAVNLDSARAFDAVIIEDHANWLREFNKDSDDRTSPDASGGKEWWGLIWAEVA